MVKVIKVQKKPKAGDKYEDIKAGSTRLLVWSYICLCKTCVAFVYVNSVVVCV